MGVEEARDAAVAQVVAAGGSIRAATALAHPDAPGTIVAYRIDAGAADPGVLAALDVVRTQTEADIAGLVPWIDPAIPDSAEITEGP